MVQELEPDDPRQIGPYRLLGRLGDGGMGRVFLGMSVGGRPVAMWQNPQLRVQTSPRIIKVAVPAPQHSPRLGHLAE